MDWLRVCVWFGGLAIPNQQELMLCYVLFEYEHSMSYHASQTCSAQSSVHWTCLIIFVWAKSFPSSLVWAKIMRNPPLLIKLSKTQHEATQLLQLILIANNCKQLPLQRFRCHNMLPEFKRPMQKKKQVSEPGDAASVWSRRAQHGRERCRRWQVACKQATRPLQPRKIQYQY